MRAATVFPTAYCPNHQPRSMCRCGANTFCANCGQGYGSIPCLCSRLPIEPQQFERADRGGAQAFALFWAILLTGAIFYQRFIYPDMTEMRFLIEYWWLFVAQVAALISYLLTKVRP